jgi:Tfp pilus assembly protein PilO
MMKINFSFENIIDYLKNKRNFFSMGMIIVAVIASFIIHVNQVKKIQSLTLAKDAEFNKSKVLTDISTSEKEIKAYKNNLSRKDIVLVTNTLTNIAKDSNVALVSVKVGTEENQLLYTRARFVCVIGADSYHDLSKFISKLENHPGIFNIDEIDIKAQDEGLDSDKELTYAPKPKGRLVVNLIISSIAFKG